MEYNLQTLVVPDADAQTPFHYSVFPVSLTVTEKFIPEGYTPQKAASISSQIDEEIRKDRIRLLTMLQKMTRALGPLGKAAARDRAIGKGPN